MCTAHPAGDAQVGTPEFGGHGVWPGMYAPTERPAGPGCGVCREALFKALSGASSTSAPGPSGLRFAHFQSFNSLTTDWVVSKQVQSFERV